MNELFREHLHGTITRPRELTQSVYLVITPQIGRSEETPPEPQTSDVLRGLIMEAAALQTHQRRSAFYTPALAAHTARTNRYTAMKAQDPARFTQALFLSKHTTLTLEQSWEELGRVIEMVPPGWEYRPIASPRDTQPLTEQDKRQTALAAKAARGSGPVAGDSWRGRSRNTKYQTK